MSIFKSSQATVSQGDTQIVCTDSVDFSTLPASSLVVIQGNKILVASGGSGVTGTTSTITLDEPYPATFPNVSNVDIVVIAGYSSVIAAVASAKLVSDNMTTTRNALQAIIDAQGTAAEANLVTGNTDKTIGRVLTTGYGGYGADIALSETDLNNVAMNGQLTRFSTGTLNRPPSIADGVVLTVARNAARRQQIAWGYSGAHAVCLSRNETAANVWTEWDDLTPRSFGIGGIKVAVSGDDFDTPSAMPNGLYALGGNGHTITAPAGITGTDAYLICIGRVAEGASAQQYQEIIDRATGKRAQRVATNNTFGAWKYVGVQGTFGIGSTDLYADNRVTDFQTTGDTGNSGLFAWGTSATDIPLASSFGILLSGNYNEAGTAAFQLAGTTSPINRLFFRGGNMGSVNWEELYHSGNTNFNEFFGNAAGDALFWGTATSTANIVIDLPINSRTVPTSLSFVGTFSVHEIDTGASVATGLTNTAFGLQGLSSTRLARITLAASGLTAGKRYEIRGESASSKLTVNF